MNWLELLPKAEIQKEPAAPKSSSRLQHLAENILTMCSPSSGQVMEVIEKASRQKQVPLSPEIRASAALDSNTQSAKAPQVLCSLDKGSTTEVRSKPEHCRRKLFMS